MNAQTDSPLETGQRITARIGVTLGQEGGIGPEVMAAAIADAVASGCDVRLHVGRGLREWAAEHVRTTQIREKSGQITIVEAASGPVGGAVTVGVATRDGAGRAFAALESVVDAAIAGEIDAIVTGPVTKSIFDGQLDRPPGQTEYVARRQGAASFAMMLAGPQLRVVPVTTHVPISAVAGLLTVERIVQTAAAAANALTRHFGISRPSVGVCGLNPHAGEGGLIGDEEARIIAPAVTTLNEMGVAATGPLSADSAFAEGLDGLWDVVICMYHDQALGPLKTVHRRSAINFTCGLTVPRMSPDHGTAFELAGRGIADVTSAVFATRRAVEIARSAQARRRGQTNWGGSRAVAQ